jgi:methanogenic corrinoid protein MtbC1
VFVVVGGHAVTGTEHARSLGADAYAASGSDMDAVLTDHVTA